MTAAWGFESLPNSLYHLKPPCEYKKFLYILPPFKKKKKKPKAQQNFPFALRLYIYNIEKNLQRYFPVFTHTVISGDIHTHKGRFSLAKLISCCQIRVLLFQSLDSKFIVPVVHTASSCQLRTVPRKVIYTLFMCT